MRVLALGSREVVTLVGEGLFDYGWDNGPFTLAKLQHPMGVTLASGEVLVAKALTQRPRRPGGDDGAERAAREARRVDR